MLSTKLVFVPLVVTAFVILRGPLDAGIINGD